ncbi:MAG: hypothetical protein A2096_13005 [Spirochaetes bacterium GWF1_41_5]|nr:MAG: hypothetical protein A2096_13005 [Spirochaetes bacterium GWF1_41_5]HBE02232.1 hypothetical protein [Spirochaetia bacterium]
MCPRAVNELTERLQSKTFRIHQERRGQTEGRIAIVKNNFTTRPLRAKGFASRERSIGISILTHNLWLLARIINALQKAAKIAA